MWLLRRPNGENVEKRINNDFIRNLTQTCNKIGTMSLDHFEALCCGRLVLFLTTKPHQARQKRHFDVIFKFAGDPFAIDKIDFNISFI